MVPNYWPKDEPFENLFPPDAEKTHDPGPGAGWALYYVPCLNASFVAIDVIHGYRVQPYLGRLDVSYASTMMASTMDRLRNSGCCGDDK